MGAFSPRLRFRNGETYNSKSHRKISAKGETVPKENVNPEVNHTPVSDRYNSEPEVEQMAHE